MTETNNFLIVIYLRLLADAGEFRKMHDALLSGSLYF